MSTEQPPKRISTKTILKQVRDGELDYLKALRLWLNCYPLQRGWYVFIIFLLLTLWWIGYQHFTSKIHSAEAERDKYFQALQPWQAMAAGIFPNQPPEKQLAMLRQDLQSISNALGYATPHPPSITIETLDGLPTSAVPYPETNRHHLKLHRLVIRNFGEVQIDNFRSRLQLPEAIVSTKEIYQSVGTSVGWRPLRIEILARGTGGRSSEGMWIGPTSAVFFLYPELAFNPYAKAPAGMDARSQAVQLSGSGKYTGVWEITIDKLPPAGHVSVLFFTSDSEEVKNYSDFAQNPFAFVRPNQRLTADTNQLLFSLEGEYQFQAHRKPTIQYFLVPILADTKSRAISASTIQTNIGLWHPVILEAY